MKPIFSVLFLAVLLVSGCVVHVNPGVLNPPAMTPPIKAPVSPTTAPSVPPANATSSPEQTTITLSAEEVAKHSTNGDCWMILGGMVFDLSSFTYHPRGTSFVPYCGRDGTNAFIAQRHDTRAADMLQPFYLGKLEEKISAPKADR